MSSRSQYYVKRTPEQRKAARAYHKTWRVDNREALREQATARRRAKGIKARTRMSPEERRKRKNEYAHAIYNSPLAKAIREDPEVRKAQNAYDRIIRDRDACAQKHALRYYTDPDYNAQCKSKAIASRKRALADPVRRPKYLKHKRDADARHRARDPEWWARKLARFAAIDAVERAEAKLRAATRAAEIAARRAVREQRAEALRVERAATAAARALRLAARMADPVARLQSEATAAGMQEYWRLKKAGDLAGLEERRAASDADHRRRHRIKHSRRLHRHKRERHRLRELAGLPSAAFLGSRWSDVVGRLADLCADIDAIPRGERRATIAGAGSSHDERMRALRLRVDAGSVGRESASAELQAIRRLVVEAALL